MPRIQHKRGTSANLASVNPTPLAGELVWDSSENAIKIGDGATAWASLAYVTATPRNHVHDGADITTGTIAYARLPVGSTTSTVCAGDDARLTDARIPTAHKASHATGGSDALTPADIGAAPAASPTFTGTVLVADGSASLPSVAFAADTDLGLYRATSNMCGIAANGNSVVEFQFTTVPLVRLGGLTSNVGVQLIAANASGTNQSGGTLVIGGSQSTGTGLGGPIHFSTAPAGNTSGTSLNGRQVRAAITGDGKFGILTTSPASALDVNGVITVSATSGSAGSYLPSLTFSGDANTGFGQVGSDSASIFTAGHERVRIESDGRMSIGGSSNADSVVRIGRAITGATNCNSIISTQTVASDVTASASVFRTFVGTQAASFTLSQLFHFSASQTTFGAGSTVTSQFGFYASSNLVGATNNFGFRSDIADGSGRWNFYAHGTAPNYFAGNVGIGSGTTSPTAALDINSNTIRLRTAKTPASASDTGNAGDICWDANYLYICIASGTWRRVAHSTW